MESFYAVISADVAESGIQSEKAKVTHKICGKPMLNWVKDAVNKAGATKIIVVTGLNGEQVASSIPEDETITKICGKNEAGHALIQAVPFFTGKKAACLFVCAHNPLITAETIKKLIENHRNKKRAMTILTAVPIHLQDEGLNSPNPYVTFDSCRMCMEQLKTNIEESLILVIEIEWLEKAIQGFSDQENIDNNGKAFLESLIRGISNKKGDIGAVTPDSVIELLGVNDRIELSLAQKIINCRIIEGHMKNGVTFLNPESCIVEDIVTIGRDTLIYPGVILEGSTAICENCVIGPNTTLKNVCAGNRVTITNSVLEDSSIDDDTKVGPFAYLRPGNKIGKNVKIGDFVEIKKSCIGDDTKISHLTYVGDAEIGRNVNIGCGVVVVNYDGQQKHKTKIGDNSFIGCNVNLISPIEVKPNAFIAAGSTITEEVPEYSLAIARSQQTIIKDWVLKKGKVRGIKTEM